MATQADEVRLALLDRRAWVLTYVREHGPVRRSVIQRAHDQLTGAMLSHAAFSRTLRELEADGLVRRLGTRATQAWAVNE